MWSSATIWAICFGVISKLYRQITNIPSRSPSKSFNHCKRFQPKTKRYVPCHGRKNVFQISWNISITSFLVLRRVWHRLLAVGPSNWFSPAGWGITSWSAGRWRRGWPRKWLDSLHWHVNPFETVLFTRLAGRHQCEPFGDGCVIDSWEK